LSYCLRYRWLPVNPHQLHQHLKKHPRRQHQKLRPYTNSEQGFSFKYPKNWRQVGLTGYTEAIWKIAFEEPVSGIAPGVGIIKYDLKGETLEDFHTRMAEELVVFGSRNVLAIVKVTINGLDAFITTFTEESPEGTIKGKEMTITKDHKIAYCVDCYSLLSDYDRVKRTLT